MLIAVSQYQTHLLKVVRCSAHMSGPDVLFHVDYSFQMLMSFSVDGAPWHHLIKMYISKASFLQISVWAACCLSAIGDIRKFKNIIYK